MNFDISHILDRWDYRPGEVMVRKIKGKDGQSRLQLRVDLGMLQMFAEGRPDGKRPNGFQSYYDFLVHQLDEHLAKHGSDETFRLNPESCTRLHLEALQYHHRYICLLQLGDHAGVERDCMRNLNVFDFVSRYAGSLELAWSLRQFQPQSLMILTRARATPLLRKKNPGKAIDEIQSGIQMIRDFYDELDRPDLRDQSLEIESLQNWLEDLRGKSAPRRKPTRREALEAQLEQAVRAENFERAAQVRDQLRNLKAPRSQS
ncbi:MAG: UvrB/UvrC motif-containing protein [Verrucomicrobia bacterium]|nr:UvrB/UvrC motif-containing protein [Verrucomicrobiota bacterium]MBI3870545.1 UvrB/UvrC motif-containing protein [Verrucomicrobiota bacterium]